MNTQITSKEKSNYSFFAMFSYKNNQYRMILSLAHQLGWILENKPQIVDLHRLGSFIKSEKSPVRKPLCKMSVKECSKLISALESMVKKKYSISKTVEK